MKKHVTVKEPVTEQLQHHSLFARAGITLLSAACILCGCGQKAGETLPPVFEPLQVLEPEAPGTDVLGTSPLVLDISNISHGYIVAQAEDDGKSKNVQLVSDTTGVTYSYFIMSGQSAVLPLTDGEGK